MSRFLERLIKNKLEVDLVFLDETSFKGVILEDEKDYFVFLDSDHSITSIIFKRELGRVSISSQVDEASKKDKKLKRNKRYLSGLLGYG